MVLCIKRLNLLYRIPHIFTNNNNNNTQSSFCKILSFRYPIHCQGFIPVAFLWTVDRDRQSPFIGNYYYYLPPNNNSIIVLRQISGSLMCQYCKPRVPLPDGGICIQSP